MYYSTLQPDWLRTLLALAFVALAAFAALAKPFRSALALWGAPMTALAVWYATDRPSNDRDWEPEYAVAATFRLHDRIVSVQHIRNFSYRAEADLTPAYYDADFPLDELASVDLVSSYWAGDSIAHVFLTFGFRDGRHLAFSIETWRAKGAGYSTLAGLSTITSCSTPWPTSGICSASAPMSGASTSISTDFI